MKNLKLLETKNIIDTFIQKCKSSHEGIICNWNKPYGITFDQLDNIANQLKEQSIDENLIFRDGLEQGYNQGIDDFLESLKKVYEPCKESDREVYNDVCERFDKIANKLKNR